jgi:phosphopantothenoylcysteine decarboxylase/phosphopantothenate--cysteine ligase
MPGLAEKEIILGISGGVAAYKAADLASKLVQQGAKVTAVMTKSAHQFIGPTTFEALTNRPVYTEMFSPREHYLGEHIGLARRAQLLVIAPATANILGCLANGLADDLLTTLALAVTCPVVVAPAMNNEMWIKPAVQRNIEQLKSDGVRIVGPGEGWLSCGVIGPGRMAEPAEIMKALEAI